MRLRAGTLIAALLATSGAAVAQTPSESASDAADDPYADVDVPLEAEGEVIEVFAERPNKPFNRDTSLKLTGEQLAERGATDLADALEVLPELRVRELGRGGRQANIRGARKGAVKILIDGVPVDEPFYGTFDLSSIPVTDIEQIRVSTSPSSPIDGPGGPGGVVEVHTRDAAGGRMLRTRGLGTALHTAKVAATGRVDLSRQWFFRGSASGAVSSRAYDIAMPDGSDVALDEDRQAATGALRFEHRAGDDRRVVIDVTAQRRAYVPPPNDEGAMDVLVIDGETAARASILADQNAGPVRLQGRAYAHTLERDSTYFADPTLAQERRSEHIEGERAGFGGLINRPHTKSVHLVGSVALDTESARVTDADDAVAGEGRSTMGEVAGGAQVELGKFRIDAAAGVAVPMGVGKNPWPEAKVSVSFAPVKAFAVKVVGARKGRLPSLRERYRTDIGNDELDPEIATFGEVEVTLQPTPWVTGRVASYYRISDGMIRFDGDQMKLINLDELEVRGVDASLDAKSGRFGGGVSTSFIDAVSSRLGTDPLDFLPRARFATWINVGIATRTGVGARVEYIGTQIDRNDELPGYATLDLTGHTALGSHLFGTIRLDNATGTEFRARSGVAGPGRTLSLGLQGEW